MTDRPNETSGTLPPRPDDMATAAPGALDDRPRATQTETPAGEAPRAAERAEPVHRGGSVGWIVVIVLIVGGVAVSPWWAPSIAPLLPWSAQIAPVPAPQAAISGTAADTSKLEQRLAGVEQQLVQLAQRPAADNPPAAQAGTDEAAGRRLEALEKRLVETEQRIGQAGQPAAPDAVASEAAQRQKDEIAALAGRIATLEQRPVAPPTDPAILADLRSATDRLGAALAALEQRVGALAKASASEADSSVDPALLLALGQLRQALQGSGPFVTELAAASTLTAGRDDVKAALAPLSDSAARGVPSLALLRQRFDGLAGSIADAGTGPVSPDDWSGQLLGRLRALVSVRRVGPAASEGPEAAVALAESTLAGDDLAGAVAALETLHGPAMVAARDWLETARRRLAAEAALGKATSLVTARLAAEQKPAAPGGSGAQP